jgi:hypothetical protein
MQLRIWKRISLTPFVRLILYTRGFSISFGHRRISWITFSKHGIRETLHTPCPAFTPLKDNSGKRSQGAAPKEIDRRTHK